MSENPKQNGYEEIGVLWFSTAKTGDKYLSGNIEVITPSGETISLSVTIFANREKFTAKSPDAKIFIKKFDNDIPF